MLVLTRKLNETVVIDGNITLHIVRLHGNSVRIGIEAPRDVSIRRGELVQATKAAQATVDEHATSDCSANRPAEGTSGEGLGDLGVVGESLRCIESNCIESSCTESSGRRLPSRPPLRKLPVRRMPAHPSPAEKSMEQSLDQTFEPRSQEPGVNEARSHAAAEQVPPVGSSSHGNTSAESEPIGRPFPASGQAITGGALLPFPTTTRRHPR